MKWPDLTRVLAPIPYAVVGAVAARLYMPERVTQDMGILIAHEDVDAAHEKLAAAGFQNEGPLTICGHSWKAPDGANIDVLQGTDVWWPEAIAAAQSNRDAQGLPIVPLPYLTMMKYQASRVQDLADISRMLGQANASALAEVRSLFRKYMPDEMNDLESLIQLGQLEYGQQR